MEGLEGFCTQTHSVFIPFPKIDKVENVIHVSKDFWFSFLKDPKRCFKIIQNGTYDKFLFSENRELAFYDGLICQKNGRPLLFFDCHQKDQGCNITVVEAYEDVSSNTLAMHTLPIITSFKPKRYIGAHPIMGTHFMKHPEAAPYIAAVYLALICKIQSEALKRKQAVDRIRSRTRQSPDNDTKRLSEFKKSVYRCYLSRDIYYRYNPTDSITRQYIRHCEAWTVRGHYRTLKSGKQIFIKPFTKGKGRLNKKIYTGG